MSNMDPTAETAYLNALERTNPSPEVQGVIDGLRLNLIRTAAVEWCHGEATSDQAMSVVLAAVGCQTCDVTRPNQGRPS